MEIGKIARDAVQVSPSATVMEAIEIMELEKVSMVAVVENRLLVGLFTLQDVAVKVTRPMLDPNTTAVGDVMTTMVRWVTKETEVHEALRIMSVNHIHHLPIVNLEGEVEGIVSFQYLMRDLLKDAEENVKTLQNYIGADSPGG